MSLEIYKTEKLSGTLMVQGSKNAVLPIMSASVINREITVLKHVPKIADVYSTIDILKYLGCEVYWDSEKLIIDATSVSKSDIPKHLTKKLRSSIIFMGALLARNKEVSIANPGGCAIGKRPIDIHIDALKKMDIKVEELDDCIYANTKEIMPSYIKLRLPSVGATQNAMLAAAGANGITVIDNAALEPEINTLAKFITLMGADVWINKRRIVVKGITDYRQVEFEIPGDRIVAGTYMAMLAGIGGNVELLKVDSTQLNAVCNCLRESGCVIDEYQDAIRIKKSRLKKILIPDFETKPYPGFPTDMMPQMTAVATLGCRKLDIVENIFESRFAFVYELLKMGADICIEAPKRLQVKGVKKLYGKEVYASDLRGGAALVLAGLMAEGKTIVHNEKYIRRGYQDICHDIVKLGGNIIAHNTNTGENDE